MHPASTTASQPVQTTLAIAGGKNAKKKGKTAQGRPVIIQSIDTPIVKIIESATKSSLQKEGSAPYAPEFNPWPTETGILKTEGLVIEQPNLPNVKDLTEEIKKLVAENQKLTEDNAEKDSKIAELSLRIKKMEKNSSILENAISAVALEHRNENTPVIDSPDWPNLKDLQPIIDGITIISKKFSEINEKVNFLRSTMRIDCSAAQQLQVIGALEKKYIELKNKFLAQKEEINQIQIEKAIYELRSIILVLEIYEPGFKIIDSLDRFKSEANNHIQLNTELKKARAALTLLQKTYDDTAVMGENIVDILSQLNKAVYPSTLFSTHKQYEVLAPFFETGRRHKHVPYPSAL